MKLAKTTSTTAKAVTTTPKTASVAAEAGGSAPANLAMAEREILEEQNEQTAKSVDFFTKFLLLMGYGPTLDATAGETGAPVTPAKQQQPQKPRVGEPIDWNAAKREAARPKNY